MENRIPPQSLSTERSVLGSMLINQDVLYEGIAYLKGADFYSSAHRTIFETMRKMVTKKIEVDLITLSNTLSVKGILENIGGDAYLSELTEEVSTSSIIESYIKILKTTHLQRELITACCGITTAAYEGQEPKKLIHDAEMSLSEATGIIADHKNIKKLSEILGASMENISDARKHEGITGITSGLPSLDSKTAGFQNSDLIIIASRPSMGKTALAITCALNAWEISGKESLIFSLEMSENQLAQRFLAIQSDVNLHSMKGGTLSGVDFKRLSLSCGPLSEAKIYIDDSFNITVSEIRSKTRRLLALGYVDQIFIDYLGLMQSETKGEKRYREIGIITRALKGIAKDFNIPVILLSQLNRAEKDRGKKERRPILSDLRESGDIEQDADLVIFIYREYEYTGKEEIKNDAELIVAKQRNGPLGKVPVKFKFENAHFVEPEPEEPDMFDEPEFKAVSHKKSTETFQPHYSQDL